MIDTVVAALLGAGALGPCAAGSNAAGTGFEVSSECHSSGEPHTLSNTDTYDSFTLEPACEGPVLGGHITGQCPGAGNCPDGEMPYNIFGHKDGVTYPLGSECRGPNTPTLTPAAVARAFQRIPLPQLRPVAQPAGKTLVNFDTIFHVEAEPLDRTLTLLGQRVELAIRPSEFRWDFGDHTTLTTTTPGAAYPSRAITHRYLDADVTVRAEVTVTWTARWRLNGGAWADVPGSVTTVGPPAVLRVVEAVPNLVATH